MINHTNCDHPSTSAARAKCRRSQGGTTTTTTRTASRTRGSKVTTRQVAPDFEGYMTRVRTALSKLTNGEFTHEDDLPDFDYHSAFEDRKVPEATARKALKEGVGF
jgi:hypothetical protein